MKKTKISPYTIALLLILLIALFWRFVNYNQRWVLNQDQARDTTIAIHAIRNQKLPLIGSPSSAGPFSFGPLYDWLVISSTILFPFTSGPWVAFTLLSTSTVFVFFLIGKTHANKRLGIFMALIAAFSSAHIANAPDMLNTVIVAFFTSLAFLSLFKFHKKKELKYLIFLGFSVGTAINCHFQSLGLLSLLLLTTLINNSSLLKKIRFAIYQGTGLLLSFLPLIFFDINQNFVWIKSVLDYYLRGQNKFYIPVRWLTDLRDFWPQLWGQIITNFPSSGYFFLLLALISLFLLLKKKKQESFAWWTIVCSLLIQIVLIRYYKGVRSPEYLIAFQIYFIFFTSWSLWSIFKKQKIIGLALTSLVIITCTVSNLKIIQQKSQAQLILSMRDDLFRHYPNTSFSFYTKDGPDMVNLPVFYLLYREEKISNEGQKIGTCRKKTENICPSAEKIITTNERYTLYNLSHLSVQELSQLGYKNYTSEKIYNRLFINYPQALETSSSSKN